MAVIPCLVPQETQAPSDAERGFPLFGSVVCPVGDADGDGAPDIVVADPGMNPHGRDPRAWLLSGKDLHTLFSRPIESYREHSALLVRGVNDADGDGTRDFLIAPAWFVQHPEWSLAIVSGRDGRTLRAIEPREIETGKRILDLAAPDGTELLAPAFAPTLGHDLRGGRVELPLADLDGDGAEDFVRATKDSIEIISLRSGRPLRRVDAPPGTYYDDSTVVVMRDVDGDNVCDLAISAPGTGVAEGRVDVYSGRTGNRLYTISPAIEENLWHFGEALAVLGDVDGDGRDDLAIGTFHGFSREPGRVVVCSGADGRVLALVGRTGEGLWVGKRFSRAR